MRVEAIHIRTFRNLLKDVIEGKESSELLVEYYIYACDIQYEMGKETGYSLGRDES